MYIGQWYLNPLQSRHLGTSHSSPSAPLYFPESHQQSEVPSLSKVILVLGKNRSHRVPNLSCRGTESPGWFDVSPKTLQNGLLESLSATPLYFPESYWRSEISFLSKVILVLGKNRNRRMPSWGYREAESPGWIDTLPKKKKTSSWDMMHEQVHCCNEAANHQLPIAVAFWIIPVVSMREWSSLTQNLMQICCSTHSVISIVTRYRCSLDGVYHPHWLD